MLLFPVYPFTVYKHATGHFVFVLTQFLKGFRQKKKKKGFRGKVL